MYGLEEKSFVVMEPGDPDYNTFFALALSLFDPFKIEPFLKLENVIKAEHHTDGCFTILIEYKKEYLLRTHTNCELAINFRFNKEREIFNILLYDKHEKHMIFILDQYGLQLIQLHPKNIKSHPKNIKFRPTNPFFAQYLFTNKSDFKIAFAHLLPQNDELILFDSHYHTFIKYQISHDISQGKTHFTCMVELDIFQFGKNEHILTTCLSPSGDESPRFWFPANGLFILTNIQMYYFDLTTYKLHQSFESKSQFAGIEKKKLGKKDIKGFISDPLDPYAVFLIMDKWYHIRFQNLTSFHITILNTHNAKYVKQLFSKGELLKDVTFLVDKNGIHTITFDPRIIKGNIFFYKIILNLEFIINSMI